MLDRDDSIQFIEKLFGDGDLSNGGLNISVVCPFCKKEKGDDYSKKKLVIRTDDHRVHCWVCDYKSKNLIHLVRQQVKRFGVDVLREYSDGFLSKFGDTSGRRHVILNASTAGIDLFEDFLEDVESVVQYEVKLPEGFIFLAEAVQNKSINKYIQRHLDYLKRDRGITKLSDLWYWKFCVAPPSDKEFGWRVIIPSFDAEGNLNYFSGRTIREHPFKYWNCEASRKATIFNECFIDWKKPLYLVEGPFDLVKTKKATSNVVPILGKVLNDEYRLAQKIIENKTPIVIAIDPEETKYQLKMAEYFTEYGIQVSTLEYPEWVDDLGATEENKVKELFQNNIKSYDSMSELRKRIERI